MLGWRGGSCVRDAGQVRMYSSRESGESLSGALTWRRIVAVRGRYVRMRSCRRLAVALALRRVAAGGVLTGLLRTGAVRRGGREVHGRVSARGGRLLLRDVLRRVSVLVVRSRGVLVLVVRIGVLHRHVAVDVSGVVCAARLRACGRRYRHGRCPGRDGGRGVVFLSGCCLQMAVSLRLLGGGERLRSIARLASSGTQVGVRLPLRLHGGRLW